MEEDGIKHDVMDYVLDAKSKLARSETCSVKSFVDQFSTEARERLIECGSVFEHDLAELIYGTLCEHA